MFSLDHLVVSLNRQPFMALLVRSCLRGAQTLSIERDMQTPGQSLRAVELSMGACTASDYGEAALPAESLMQEQAEMSCRICGLRRWHRSRC